MSYTEFKRTLDYTYGFSEKEIFYIIGILFEKTDGFERSHKEIFYGLRRNTVFHIEWSKDTYGWDIEIEEW